MHLPRWVRSATTVVLAAASVAMVATVAPPASATATPWSGQQQGLWGHSWRHPGLTAVTAIHSVNPGVIVSSDHMFSPSLYPGGLSCFEMTTVFYSDGKVYLLPYDWCGQPGANYAARREIDADFHNKYVSNEKYTIKIERTDAATNTWTAYLWNVNTLIWEELYSKGGVHSGDDDAGWDYYEVFTDYNADTGVGNHCDRMAGYKFSAEGLNLKINGSWTSANSSNTNVADSAPANYCPGLITTRGDNWWTVTNPPLACNVHAVISGSGGTFTLAVQVFNTNAYHINGWDLQIELNGSQTVTNAVGASFSQSGNTVTVTNGTNNETMTADGGVVTFALQGTYSGTNTNPTDFTLDTGYTPNTCTVV